MWSSAARSFRHANIFEGNRNGLDGLLIDHHVDGVAAKTALFDHLVGAGDERRRHCEAERLGGLEVDHKLVFSRCLHRQVGWLLAFQDAINVTGSATELVYQNRAIGY